MKTLIKGALMGLGLGIFFVLLSYIATFGGRTTCPGIEECATTWKLNFLMYPAFIGALPWAWIAIDCVEWGCMGAGFIMILLGPITYFIIGAIIGWIIGKTKSK